MKKWMYNALILFFAVVMVCSAGYLAYYFIDSAKQERRFEDLSQLRGDPVRPTVGENAEIDPDVPPTTLPPDALVEVTNEKTGKTATVMQQFAELYALNSDIIGWITIPGTDIDYPVMQTPKKTDYYLRRSFDKVYSTRGCIYARESCDLFTPDDNITIYGHRMRDRTMFAQLDGYMKKAFYKENPYIYFDTLREMHTYQIISVFLTTASIGEGFAYHEFEKAESPEEFDAFVSTCKELALYDTGISAEYGDKLITLSTCEYSQENGRLVIVAKRVA